MARASPRAVAGNEGRRRKPKSFGPRGVARNVLLAICLKRGDLAKASAWPERRRVRFHDPHLVDAGHARDHASMPRRAPRRRPADRRREPRHRRSSGSAPSPERRPRGLPFRSRRGSRRLGHRRRSSPGRSLSRSSWPGRAVVWMELSAGEFDAVRFDPEKGEDRKRHGDDRGACR